MMKRFSLSLFALAFSVNLALAADSAANRSKSILQLGTSTSGGNVSNNIAPPATLAFHFNNKLILGLEQGIFEGETEGESNGYTFETDGEYKSQGIAARWFTGNSFNIFLALHQRTWDVSLTAWPDQDASPSVFAIYDLTAKATVATLAIGNQWQADWGGVFGVDWISVATAVSAESSYEPKGISGWGDASDREKAARDAGDYLNLISAAPFGAFNLYLAYSF